MNILVTGGLGFIGRHVVAQLLQRGHSVRIADNQSKYTEVPKGVEFQKIDLTDYKQTRNAMKGMGGCINLASKMGGIGYIHNEPATILEGSLRMFGSVFEACRAENIKRIVHTSSSMVLERTTTFPSKETDVENIAPPRTTYGFAKLVGEYYCRASHEQHGVPFTLLRPFNTYGVNAYIHPEVGYSNVIPDLIRKIFLGGKLTILGNGQQTRSFTHVTDTARAFVLAIEKPEAENEDFFIGSDQEISVLELAKKLWLLCRKEESFSPVFVPGYVHDTQRRIPDISKARTLLGWEPTKDFDEGLAEVIDWIKTTHVDLHV